ncbi:unnamed protein product [Brassicogethes aeneus]|uniref:Chitin-binding type-2 domain-containing protein n=1 Tax=Brassicogethes aeneus TaxID=1431903 RepID=A0A9P0FEW5_BRAAE|nr:unnamed protein product [Brassicogethes aeneus]
MKRPPGLWILLSAGVLWLSLQDVYGIRATALIFGKSSTTTTTELPATDPAAKDESLSSSTEANGDVMNVTKPPLTGNPQIDYIWDPNLPKELNGHNLSDYPFYERVPDEVIAFKCDGLHDGFYASIPHKCQVYHHCLFGTRYDFLCANYTAFDQKTFICHFASEVDCANSKKYWHRNDDLYQAASTTTAKSLVIPTTPPPTGPLTVSPLLGGGFRRPNGGRRRLRPRVRPQYDYYEDEYYDEEYYERPRRKKRPRPRRPAYEEEEYGDEYEERFERRGSGRRDENRKRPYDRRDDEDEEPPRKRPGDRRKNKDRRTPDYEDEEETKSNRRDEETKSNRRDNDNRKTDDKRSSDRNFEKRRPHGDNEDRKSVDEDTDKQSSSSDRKYEKRRNEEEDTDKRSSSSERKFDKRRNEEEDTDKRSSSSERKFEKRRPYLESKSRNSEDEIKERGPADKSDRRRQEDEETPRKPPRKSSRRPYKEYEEDTYDDRDYDRPRKSEERRNPPKEENSRAIIKPVSGTIYDRPRLAPRIKLPVPKNEADKYAYKHVAIATKPPAVLDEEYYDDYEEEEPRAKPSRKSTEVSERPDKHKEESKEVKKNFRPRDVIEESEEKQEKTTTKRPKFNVRGSTRHSTTTPKKPIVEEYYDDDYVEEPVKTTKPKIAFKPKSTSTSTSTTTSTTTTTTTTEKPELKSEQIVRVVKRPFLPSRGGNPYSGRGLQPVGLKAQPQYADEDYEEKTEEIQEVKVPIANKEPTFSMKESFSSTYKDKNEEFKPSPVILKVPVRQKYAPIDEDYDITQPEVRKPYVETKHIGPRTTQKPKVPERNPLDLNEYDVTLNDALNPTLPNLPVRGFPTGFSAAQDYTYSNFQRPRYVVDPVLSQSSSDYSYRPKLSRPTRYEGQANTDIPNANLEYQGYSGQNLRPRQQQQTQAFYF